MADRMGNDGAMAVPRRVAAAYPWFPDDASEQHYPGDVIDVEEADRPVIHRPAPGTSLYLPQNYTPRYNYPLLIWLSDNDGAHQLADWLPRISDRNYLALEIPASLFHPGVSISPGNRLARLLGIVRTVLGRYPVHADRITLVGCGCGAETALEWFCQRPDQFSGFVSLNGRFESSVASRAAAGGSTRRRALLIDEHAATTASTLSAQLLLQSLKVETSRPTLKNSQHPKESCGQQINHWLMSGIPSTINATN